MSEHRRQQHHRQDRKILHDEDPGTQPAMGRVHLPAIGDHLKDDCRAAHGRQESPEDSLIQLQAEGQPGCCRERNRGSNLKKPASQDGAQGLNVSQ